MQVIDQGCGDYIKKGTSVDVLVALMSIIFRMLLK